MQAPATVQTHATVNIFAYSPKNKNPLRNKSHEPSNIRAFEHVHIRAFERSNI